MKIKNMSKYIYKQSIKTYAVYAGIILCLILLAVIFNIGKAGNMGGTEAGSALCIIVATIMFYRDNIAMSCQNGVSRKCFILSNAAVLPAMALTAAAGDTLLSIIGNFFEKHGGAHFDSLYENNFLYEYSAKRFETICIPTAYDYFKTFIFYMTVFMAAVSFGLIMACIIYRLPKGLKVIVPVVFYVFVFVVLPVIVALIATSERVDGSWVVKLLVKILNFIGWVTESVLRMSLTLLITSVVLFAISALVIRRTPITDKSA